MKKILYIITQSELGGAQRYLFDLVDNLHEEFEISIALGEQGKDGELAKKLEAHNVKVLSIPHLKRAISPFKDLLAIVDTIKLLKKIKPDIVHLNSSKVSIIGSLASIFVKKLKARFVYTVHGWVFNEPLSGFKKSFYTFAEKFTARFKDRIICISSFDYEIAKKQLKIPEKKLTLIHHGIDPIKFLTKGEAREKFKSLMPDTQSKIVIGVIANLYRTKGLEYLIEAARLATDLGFNIVTIVIGEGSERKNLESVIGQNNLRSKFFLAGKMENAAELLPVFDIYVSSSIKEGLPYNILEAMQAGLPIIATNVGGIPEMITDGKNGLLVNPEKPKELAQRIKLLIEDNQLRESLKQQAQADANSEFTIDKMIKKTKEAYSN